MAGSIIAQKKKKVIVMDNCVHVIKKGQVQAGFSLFELLIALILLSIISLSFFNGFSLMQQTYLNHTKRFQIEQYLFYQLESYPNLFIDQDMEKIFYHKSIEVKKESNQCESVTIRIELTNEDLKKIEQSRYYCPLTLL